MLPNVSFFSLLQLFHGRTENFGAFWDLHPGPHSEDEPDTRPARGGKALPPRGSEQPQELSRLQQDGEYIYIYLPNFLTGNVSRE